MTDPGGSPPPFAGLVLVVSIDDEGWEREGLGDIEALLADAIRASALRAGLPDDIETELSVTLTGDAEIQVLNAEWRGKDGPTNVLSFPMSDLAPGETPGPMLGDLVMARETLLREALSEDKRLVDHVRHLAVHGFLHCLGFDHVEPEDAQDMEALEVEILSDLGIADPYALADRLDDEAARASSDDMVPETRERWVVGR